MFISSNKGLSKKSLIVIFRPMHKLNIVSTLGEVLRPENTSCTVDCVTPDIMHNLFKVMFRSLQKPSIRLAIASPIVMKIPPNVYRFSVDKL